MYVAGYGRVAALIASMYYMTTTPYCAVMLYLTAVILDEFDGIFSTEKTKPKLVF